MSSVTLVSLQLIIFICNLIDLRQTMFNTVNACDLFNGIHLQNAAFTHSVILRVQPMLNNDLDWRSNSSAQVLVREVIKSTTTSTIHLNDLIHIRLQEHQLDHTCWHLLRRSTSDLILFLNQSKEEHFDLSYPPVESTYRVREHINAVLSAETYPPQVLIRTRPDQGIISREYSLQCNSRGNPLPRLFWSKKIDSNQTEEIFYPSHKQCHNSCRIYSIQHKYQSVLIFQFLVSDDIGIYICHAENPMNRTSTSVYLRIDPTPPKNLTCAPLNFCYHRGRCILLDQQLKCLCDSQYFGEQCQNSYAEIVHKQESDNAILLFKSRFLAGFILIFVAVVLILLAILSWYLARNNQKQLKKAQQISSSAVSAPASPALPPAKPLKPVETLPIEKKEPIDSNGCLPLLAPQEPPPPAVMRVSHSPLLEKRVAPSPPPEPPRRIITRESSTATEDDEEQPLTSYLKHHPVLPPVNSHVDEEYEERFSLRMNQSEELGLGYVANGLLHNTDNVQDFSPVDESGRGLIKPLSMNSEYPPRYTKYVSSYSKFILPRPVFHSSMNYSQR